MPRNPKLAPLREQLKAIESEIRSHREDARKTFGDSRWSLQHHARGMSPKARILHLTLSLLRGRKIEQIESPHSDPSRFPDVATISKLANEHYRPMAEGESPEVYEATRVAWRKDLESSLQTWRAKLIIAAAETTAREVA